MPYGLLAHHDRLGYGADLVDAGNSGAEIAAELAYPRRVVIAGRSTGELPFRPSGRFGRLLGVRLVLRVVFHRVLTIRNRAGRKVYPRVTSHGGPLIRTRLGDLARAGVEHVGRVTGVRDGVPVLEDGRPIDAANVIWCTGFDPGFSWIDLPIFDRHGHPRHDGGVVPEAPGLYFVGLHFLYSLSSAMVHGVGRDARRIAAAVAQRAAEKRSPRAGSRPQADRRGGTRSLVT